jgi:glycolate oxidase iron-sulfur subunit
MGNNLVLKLSSIGMGIARILKMPNILGGLLPIDNTAKTYQKMQIGPGMLNGSENRSIELNGIRRAGYFKGCAMKMFFPSASDDTVRLLKKQNLEVVIPDANCCGIPHLAHGMQEKAMELAVKNMEKFKDVELIITDCASCGSMFKRICPSI